MYKNLNVLDLFCGAGGLSCGFEQAGFNILLGVDNDEMALKTYLANHKFAKVIKGDITSIDYSTITNILEGQTVDVVIGGPPCQGFSIAGKRFIDDPRNHLYKGFVRLVKNIKPKLFVMENVPNLVSLGKGIIKDNIINDFQEIGYNVTYSILTASDYGVPQQRKRVFFVGIDQNIKPIQYKFSFPEPVYGVEGNDYITTEDAISDLDFLSEQDLGNSPSQYKKESLTAYQKSMREGCELLYNHIATKHTEKVKHIISMVPDGGNYKSLPIEYQKTRNVHIAWTRMNSKKPCFTIDTGHNHHFHYKDNRVPTPREVARIQSFPDKYIFYGTKTAQLKQIGNAVPPLLAKALANKILDFLEKNNV